MSAADKTPAAREVVRDGEVYIVGSRTGANFESVYLYRAEPVARDHPDFLWNLVVVPWRDVEPEACTCRNFGPYELRERDPLCRVHGDALRPREETP